MAYSSEWPLDVSVVVPVGPKASHRRWLGECLRSVLAQTTAPRELIIVDDMHGLSFSDLPWDENAELDYGSRNNRCLEDAVVTSPRPREGFLVRIFHAPWLLGVAHAFNAGVGLARSPWVLMLGADDELEPDAISGWVRSQARVSIEAALDSYWYFGVRYMDTGETQTVPCNAAVVSKRLWHYTGGFAPETASGAPDAAFVSLLMTHPELGALRPVEDGAPLYRYRRHGETDTAGRGPWQGVILSTRDILARTWTRPDWGRT